MGPLTTEQRDRSGDLYRYLRQRLPSLKKECCPRADRDALSDLLAEAALEAAVGWDSQREALSRSFAEGILRRKLSKAGARGQLDRPQNEKGLGRIEARDRAGETIEEVVPKSRYTPTEYRFLVAIYCEGCTPSEAAEAVGWSSIGAAPRNRISRLLERLRADLGGVQE